MRFTHTSFSHVSRSFGIAEPFGLQQIDATFQRHLIIIGTADKAYTADSYKFDP